MAHLSKISNLYYKTFSRVYSFCLFFVFTLYQLVWKCYYSLEEINIWLQQFRTETWIDNSERPGICLSLCVYSAALLFYLLTLSLCLRHNICECSEEQKLSRRALTIVNVQVFVCHCVCIQQLCCFIY